MLKQKDRKKASANSFGEGLRGHTKKMWSFRGHQLGEVNFRGKKGKRKGVLASQDKSLRPTGEKKSEKDLLGS